MNVKAKELWTGDVVLLHGKVVTKFQWVADGDVLKVTLADIELVRGDPPVEVHNEKVVSYRPHEEVQVVRGRPLANGMHMTQIDADGMLRGHAHPALEQKFRLEGKLAPDYQHG